MKQIASIFNIFSCIDFCTDTGISRSESRTEIDTAVKFSKKFSVFWYPGFEFPELHVSYGVAFVLCMAVIDGIRNINSTRVIVAWFSRDQIQTMSMATSFHSFHLEEFGQLQLCTFHEIIVMQLWN